MLAKIGRNWSAEISKSKVEKRIAKKREEEGQVK
jgi:hypothetical protein